MTSTTVLRIFSEKLVFSFNKNVFSSLITFQTRNFHLTPAVHRFRDVRYWRYVEKPKPGVKGKSYRRRVHFEDKYTVKPLNVTNLAGRDPVSGRKVCQGIGGGIKHKFHQIDWYRKGPEDLNEPPKEERVLEIFPDGCRTSWVALVGSGKQLRYVLATQNMQVGDIIKTHMGIPKIPIVANEGDAYPLGALPVGTRVHCVEKYAGASGCLVHAAGTFATITRKYNDRVVVKVPSKREFSLHQKCMAVVGRLSNELHGSTPIGSPNRARELGYRPRSGLWHWKHPSSHGRKIKPTPPVRTFDTKEYSNCELVKLHLSGYDKVYET